MNRIESFTSKCFSKKKEILLIIPPFSILEYPCIGVDILYNIACAQNIGIDVFYANIAFADFIGVPKYEYISKKLMSLYNLIGERIFSKVAYSEKQILGYLPPKHPISLSQRKGAVDRIFMDTNGLLYNCPLMVLNSTGTNNPPIAKCNVKTCPVLSKTLQRNDIYQSICCFVLTDIKTINKFIKEK